MIGFKRTADIMQRFRVPDKQISSGQQVVVKRVDHAALHFIIEIDNDIAAKNNVVMDGRDIGTCVLPDADVKVYLTASTGVRAKRRYDELAAKGEETDLAQIEEDIRKRDEQDMNRKIAPLKQAEDAVLVDSSHMTIDEVVQAILDLCK